jgi:hypothetical protein
MPLTYLSPRPVMGSETVTVDATAGGVALTSTTYTKQTGNGAADRVMAKVAFISVEDQQIRVNFDPAVTVTASTNGHEFGDGDSFLVEGEAIKNLRAICTGGTSGVMRVTYYA